jgi:hypothetical protein
MPVQPSAVEPPVAVQITPLAEDGLALHVKVTGVLTVTVDALALIDTSINGSCIR